MAEMNLLSEKARGVVNEYILAHSLRDLETDELRAIIRAADQAHPRH